MVKVQSHKLFLFLAVALVAWGALSFGAVYPWAYGPLLAGSAVAGLLGMLMPGPRPAPVNWPIALSLAALVLAVGCQLVPVPRSVMLWINPETDAYLQQANLRYVLQLATRESVWHPLSIRPDRTLLGLAFLGAFGLLLLGSARAFSVINPRRFTGALVAFAVLLALIGLIQKNLMLDKPYGFWEPIDGKGNPFGPFINRNHFAGWMLMALPLSLGHFGGLLARGMPGVRPGWRNRVAWFSTPAASAAVLTGFGVVVIALSLVMTLSRSGLACFCVAMALFGGRWLRRNSGVSRRALGVAYVSVVLIAAIGWTGIDTLAARLERAQTRDVAVRLGAWADAVDIATAFPVAGTGLNTYGFATRVYQKHELRRHYVEAHNDYLQVAAEGGVLLAIPALALLGVVVYQLARSRQGRTTGRWIRAGALTGLIAIGLQEIIEFSLQVPGNALLFTLVLGLALAHRESHHPQPGNVRRPGMAGVTI